GGLGRCGSGGLGLALSTWGRRRYAPLPERRRRYPGPSIALHRPDRAGLRGSGRTLAAVRDDRRSIRSYDDASPIDSDQLGTLLYRCARARGGDGDGAPGRRPYPAGGAGYELELYPVVRRVRGLAPGMDHYD